MLFIRNVVFSCIISVLFFSCQSTKLLVSIDKSYKISNDDEITIGCVEVRSRGGDSFLGKNFRDALKFEFVSAGYKVTSESELNNAFLSSGIPYLRCLREGEIFALTQSSSFNFFIQSYIQEVKVGDLLREKLHTSIVLHLYTGNGGKQIGEIRFFSKGSTIESNLHLQEMIEMIVRGLKEKDAN